MIKVHGFTYGDQVFATSRKLAFDSLCKHTDSATLFTENELKSHSTTIDSRILYSGARGGGYWIFKPLFLKQKMMEVSYGEAVMWMDAGIECIKDTHILADIALQNRGFCLFQQIHKNSDYTKRDCFYYMNADSNIFYNARQCDAAIQLYIKNDETLKFIDDYLHYCSDYRVITDCPNECNLPNIEGFIDHRHDQSILTNLCIKYKLDRFIQPTVWYDLVWPENIKNQYLNSQEKQQSEKYGPMFDHHRRRQ